jgi:uncharacterized protein YutE (UPF0331/DUF86 family)
MTTSTPEADLLASLVPQLEAEGYEVYVHPSRSLLPPFMRHYVPDLVAFGGPKNVAIEIKRPSAAAEESLTRISALFEGQKDWDLRILFVSPNSSSRTLAAQPPGLIQEAVSEVHTLVVGEHYRPALLLSWAAFEAVGRALLEKRLAKPQTPSRLIEVLAAEGYITPSEADDLRLLAEKRNSLVHGGIDVEISKEEVDRFVTLLQTLISMTREAGH